jgi:hypothetical protein
LVAADRTPAGVAVRPCAVQTVGSLTLGRLLGQLEAPEEFDGCSPYELVTRVGDAETVPKATPHCPD